MRYSQTAALQSHPTILHEHGAAVCRSGCKSAVVHAQQADNGLGSQIAEFFGGLLDTSKWPPRWHCGTWSDFQGWLYILSDLLIWASYFAIPVLLIHMLKKRKDIPFSKIIGLFIAFIILCGTTHFLDAIIFWWPAYRLSALIRLVTGIVSAVTVYALFRIMPGIMNIRTVADLEREINDRKIAEEKLAASELLLREAGRIARMGAWEYDCATKICVWADTVYDIFDIPQTFDINKNEIYPFFTEPSRQQLKDAVERALTDNCSWELELQIITGKGVAIWVRSCGEVICDSEKKVTKLQGVIIDIDRQKSSEIALQKSHEMLFQSHQQLKSFTHILSHNIRNHASNISLLSDLIDTDTLDNNNADLFDKITKVSNGLNETLNDLSEAIKIRENKVTPERLSFSAVTSDVIQVLESEMLAANFSIKLDFKVDEIIFPKLYLESILINLVSNAIKYRRDNVLPEVILRSYTNKLGQTVLECQDNGLGIDLALHGNRIFGLYKTFHSHKEAHGVGLFLVKTQVESQGGVITVQSEPGSGTTFKIIF